MQPERTVPLLSGLRGWWEEQRRRRAARNEIHDAGAEAGGIARDLGVSTDELYQITGRGPDSARLLYRRMNALGLDAARLSRRQSMVMRDLQKTCTLCTGKRRCAHDLAARPDDPRWRAYCPNARTLDSLESIPS